jgi:membrane associated rhomboid family serine protease
MLPLKDENPTHRTPVVTVLIIVACLWVYFGWQPSLGPQDTVDVPTPEGVLVFDGASAFAFENAAIPCEVVRGRPLNVDEMVETFERTRPDESTCSSSAGSAVFPDKSVWLALITSMFLHGSLLHLGGNLLFLWIFGNNIEDHLGHVRFLLFYLIGGLVASAAHIGLNLESTIPVVGASGAIAAVMGAYLVWFPDAPVRTVVILVFFVTFVDLRAKWLLGFWLVSQFFTNPNSGVAWGAHVGGFVFGVVIGLIVRASGSIRRASWTPDYQPRAGARWDATGGAGYRPYRNRRWGRG